MSALTIARDDNANEILLNTTDGQEIQTALNAAGVRFERWEADTPITKGMSNEEILAAYQTEITRLVEGEGYQTVDVISLSSDHPDKDALRQKFLSEHTHTEDEVRFFVAGEGVFYLHIDDKVYQVHCCKDDLISVPANVTHWFDMGPNPNFTAIRFFDNPEGWVAHFTGNDIANHFPMFEG
jgi:1,2-dihydroxy-3-keto-5-methylthiopentene dioxygenase